MASVMAAAPDEQAVETVNAGPTQETRRATSSATVVSP
jgi:hypothetical protein